MTATLTVGVAHHRAIRRAHDAAAHLHDLTRELVSAYPADAVPLAIRDLETMAGEVSGYLATSLSVLRHEADPNIRRAMRPDRDGRAA